MHHFGWNLRWVVAPIVIAVPAAIHISLALAAGLQENCDPNCVTGAQVETWGGLACLGVAVWIGGIIALWFASQSPQAPQASHRRPGWAGALALTVAVSSGFVAGVIILALVAATLTGSLMLTSLGGAVLICLAVPAKSATNIGQYFGMALLSIFDTLLAAIITTSLVLTVLGN